MLDQAECAPDAPPPTLIAGEHDWMDWRHMAAVRQAIEAAREHGSGAQIASSRSCGPQIEILHVAGADHNVQIDNPLGFVDSVMATCDPRGIHAGDCH